MKQKKESEMGSGAGKMILPLISLAAAPATGGGSLLGLGGAGGAVGTAAGIANAGAGLLRERSRARSDTAEAAAEIGALRTERLADELSLAEDRLDAEKRRARVLAGIANSGGTGARAKAGIAAAADREGGRVFASLDARQAAVDARARNRIAALRRKTRRDNTEDMFGLLERFRSLPRQFDSTAF